jgi:hypothetical protein
MQRTQRTTRTTRTTLAAVALATSLTALAGCGRPAPTQSVSAQAAPPAEAAPVTEVPFPETKGGVEITPEQRAYVERWEKDEPQGVVDSKGEERGTILPSEADAQSDRVLARLTQPPKPDEEGPQVREVSTREREAYQVLESIEVRSADGEVTGYWAGVFISKEDYPAAVAEAERITGEKASDQATEKPGG